MTRNDSFFWLSLGVDTFVLVSQPGAPPSLVFGRDYAAETLIELAQPIGPQVTKH